MMNFLARTWRYVTRTRVKSILLMVTFFVIGNFVILGLGISTAADNAKVLTRKQMKAVVNYEVDSDSYYTYVNSLTDQDEINKAYQNYPKIDMDTAKTLAADSRVVAYNYMVSNNVYSDGFDNVPVGNEDQLSQNNMTYATDANGNQVEYKDPNISIEANLTPNMIEMSDGTFSLVSGNYYTQSDIDDEKMVCAITKELADQNNLHVGDTITLDMLDTNSINDMVQTMGYTKDQFTMELTICGIYSTTQDVDPNSDQFKWMSPYASPKNVILMPLTSYARVMTDIYSISQTYYAQQYGMDTSDSLSSDEMYASVSSPSKVTYLLDDPLEVDQFVTDYTSKLGDYQKLDANNETFKKLARPLDTLSFFANVIVWIVVVNAIVIISLITALTLKTREYEIGVLLSIGVSKFKIVLQMFLELILIAFVGFAFAAVSGSLLAGKVGDLVLSYQTSTDAQYEGTTTNNDYYYFSDDNNYFTDITQEDMLSQYHVSVSPMLIAEIYLLGTGVVLIAILIPSFMIMRLNPKQILLEQN